MQGYVIRRVLWLIPVMIFISLITFALMHSVPGGPWDREKKLAPEVVENLNRRYGLDKPIWEQYVNFLGNAVRGDLGISFIYQNRPVTDVIMEGLPATATLAAAAIVFALVIGVPRVAYVDAVRNEADEAQRRGTRTARAARGRPRRRRAGSRCSRCRSPAGRAGHPSPTARRPDRGRFPVCQEIAQGTMTARPNSARPSAMGRSRSRWTPRNSAIAV